MEKYEDAPEIVQNFLKYKGTTQNRSAKTVFQYYHDLRTYTRFLLKRKYSDKYSQTAFGDIPFSDATDALLVNATHEDVFEFTFFTTETLKNNVASRQRKISCLRSFYKFLVNNRRILDRSPMEAVESPKMPKKLPKYLTLDESIKLLSSIEGKNAVRDYCIITLFLNCGMRVSELCGIDLSDISSDLSTVNVTGKGSKERMLYLNEACKNALAEYLKIRNADKAKLKDKNALFISRNHNRLSVQMVQTLIYRHLKSAGLENRNMSVHKLRHTAATLMYQHGKTDVRVLKDILGHEQLSTTQIYTHVNNEMIKNASENNPLSSQKKSKASSQALHNYDAGNNDESQE